jgi:hypothetical protein
MVYDHYCNEPLRCPRCIRRFYQWAERHTQGRIPGPEQRQPTITQRQPPRVTFYEAAGRTSTCGAPSDGAKSSGA